MQRLIGITERGEKIIQETRSYDADTNLTFSLRTKEDADDYRYFPEPDLTPFKITDEYLTEIKNSLPVLPAALKKKYIEKPQLPEYDASVICEDKELAGYFEEVIIHCKNYKAVANWLLGPVKSHLNDSNAGYGSFSLLPVKLAALIQMVDDGKLSFGMASSKLFPALLDQPEKEPATLAAELNLIMESDSSSIEKWVMEAIAKMPDKAAEYAFGVKSEWYRVSFNSRLWKEMRVFGLTLPRHCEEGRRPDEAIPNTVTEIASWRDAPLAMTENEWRKLCLSQYHPNST